MKPGEPRGTGGEPLEPQLGSDGRCSRQIHSSPVRGGMGTPLPSACTLTTGSGCCQLHREEKRLSPPGHFALGFVKAPAPPPPLFHSHPWPPGGKTGIQHANLLREPAFQGSCCLARGSLSCHLLWGRLMKPLCEQTPARGGDPRSPAQLQVGAAAGLPGGVFVPAYVTVSYFHWQDQADCPG